MQQDWKDMLASLATPSDGSDSTSVAPDTEHKDIKEKPVSQLLHIVVDKKGRKGKVATIIEGFTLDDAEVEEIASELKRKIGTGGSSRGGEILLQGDWREKAALLLKEKGFKVK